MALLVEPVKNRAGSPTAGRDRLTQGVVDEGLGCRSVRHRLKATGTAVGRAHTRVAGGVSSSVVTLGACLSAASARDPVTCGCNGIGRGVGASFTEAVTIGVVRPAANDRTVRSAGEAIKGVVAIGPVRRPGARVTGTRWPESVVVGVRFDTIARNLSNSAIAGVATGAEGGITPSPATHRTQRLVADVAEDRRPVHCHTRDLVAGVKAVGDALTRWSCRPRQISGAIRIANGSCDAIYGLGFGGNTPEGIVPPTP